MAVSEVYIMHIGKDCHNLQKCILTLVCICFIALLTACSSYNDVAESANSIPHETSAPEAATIVQEPPTSEMTESPFLGLRQEAGFDSPENAVREYIEGMKNHDLVRMTNAFAIDTYVQHFDYEASLERFGLTREKTKDSDITLPAPPTAETRLQEIVNSILFQYWVLNATEFGAKDFPDFADETGLAEEMLSHFDQYWENPDTNLLNTGKLIGFIPPEMLIKDEQIRQNILDSGILRGNISEYADIPYDEITDTGVKQTKHTGADKFENLVAVIEFDSNPHLMLVVAYAYGDRWYLESFGGNIGCVLFIPPQLQSVMFRSHFYISDSELEEYLIPA